MAAFVRGQVSVCLILGTFYAIALMLAGLQFGLIVGAIAGLVTFIPYVGALIGGGLAVGLALFQFWGDWLSIGIIAAIFAVGQFLEGNIITPRLVGKSVGLHPVWLLFALSAFGTLFGFVGLLVAVPVAAALGVILRFAIGRYTESRLYSGLEGLKDRAPAKARDNDIDAAADLRSAAAHGAGARRFLHLARQPACPADAGCDGGVAVGQDAAGRAGRVGQDPSDAYLGGRGAARRSTRQPACPPSQRGRLRSRISATSRATSRPRRSCFICTIWRRRGAMRC